MSETTQEHGRALLLARILGRLCRHLIDTDPDAADVFRRCVHEAMFDEVGKNAEPV